MSATESVGFGSATNASRSARSLHHDAGRPPTYGEGVDFHRRSFKFQKQGVLDMPTGAFHRHALHVSDQVSLGQLKDVNTQVHLPCCLLARGSSLVLSRHVVDYHIGLDRTDLMLQFFQTRAEYPRSRADAGLVFRHQKQGITSSDHRCRPRENYAFHRDARLHDPASPWNDFPGQHVRAFSHVSQHVRSAAMKPNCRLVAHKRATAGKSSAAKSH